MIVSLNVNDRSIANNVLQLQRKSYLIEASLINYYRIPALLESIEELVLSRENFYGYLADGILTGILSTEYSQSDCIICRLAVSPDYFKKGIGTNLLKYVEDMNSSMKLIATTGYTNTPAINLYLKRGFVATEKFIVDSLTLQQFEK